MEKIKLLVVSDAACVPSGFGRVAESVLDRLHATGRYDIYQLGINYFDDFHDKPYKIFTATAKSKTDWLGFSRIKELYESVKPDVTFLFQDFWHIASFIQVCPNMRGLCVYYPVDAPNIKSNYAVYLASAVEVATYTNFAAEETSKALRFALDNVNKYANGQVVNTIKLKAEGGNLIVSANRLIELTDPKNIRVIPHGSDLSVFYPIPKQDARKFFEFDQDWFIVGNFNRNQSRKRQDLTIRAFADFAKDKPNARLLLHDPLPSQGDGWDCLQLANERYGVGDKVLSNIKSEDGKKSLTLDKLNLLYNTLDVMVNSGGGEGWGLTTSESAACGIPQIVPDWSATGEIWRDAAMLLPISSVRHEPTINTEQCVIDTKALTAHLNLLYKNEKVRNAVARKCMEVALKPEYTWDSVANEFDKMFQSAAEKKHIE